MKKFLGKLPVMITFVALAVIMTVAYIGLLVRPVAVGFTYKGKVDFIGTGTKQEVSIKVKSGSKVNVKISADGQSIEMEDVRYVEHDRKIFVLFDYMGEELTDKQYKEIKEDIIENWDLYEQGSTDINAFYFSKDGEKLTCTGSIIFAAVGGVVELALLTFGTLSVIYFVKSKKKA